MLALQRLLARARLARLPHAFPFAGSSACTHLASGLCSPTLIAHALTHSRRAPARGQPRVVLTLPNRNKGAEDQLKFFQGCVAAAYSERDHSLMESEKAKDREESMADKLSISERRVTCLFGWCLPLRFPICPSVSCLCWPPRFPVLGFWVADGLDAVLYFLGLAPWLLGSLTWGLRMLCWVAVLVPYVGSLCGLLGIAPWLLGSLLFRGLCAAVPFLWVTQLVIVKKDSPVRLRFQNIYTGRLEELESAYHSEKERHVALENELGEIKEKVESFEKVVNKFYAIRQQDVGPSADHTWQSRCSCLLDDSSDKWIFNSDGKSATSTYIASLEEEIESRKKAMEKLQNNLRMGLQIEQHLRRSAGFLEKKQMQLIEMFGSGLSSLRHIHKQLRADAVKLLEEEVSHWEAVLLEVHEKLLPVYLNSEPKQETFQAEGEHLSDDNECKDVHITDDVVTDISSKGTDMPTAGLSSRMHDASDALSQALQEKVAALLLLSQQEERHLLEREMNAALQQKMEELQRNLSQVTVEKIEALMELAQLKREYQMLHEMELQNTPFTVQLGRGASIQLANAVINTGNSEATIRFGSLEFSAATAKAAAVPVHGITVPGHTARPNSAETYARRVNSVQQPRATRIATAKAVQQNRTSVFERLSHPEVSTVKRTDIKQKTLPILSSIITLPTEPFVPGRHDHEASSSGGKLSRRQRRKLNAKLRAQQPLHVHPSTLPALEPEANVPTHNKFANLKWVKRNSSTGELKQSFWEQQQQAPAPQKKKYETLSARVHRVLKVARENGLMKKKYQKPFINNTARIPRRELPAVRIPWKGKEIWRPRLPERKLLEKNVRIGVTSGIASQRSASKKNRQQWVPKEKVPIINAYNSRHLGESSKESYCQPTSTYQKKINVDRTPPIEEVSVPHPEPEIYWKRRSEIRVQENDEEEDTMEVEVVYMVVHGDEPHQTRGYKRRNEPGPTSSKTTTSQEDQIQYEQLEEEEVPSGDDQNDDQEEEVLAETLAQAQRRLKFQMKEKDKEISELNSKMTEMMAQMTAMMQLMQKNIITNPAHVQPANHQSSIPTNLPTNPVPQVFGIRTTHEEENEADQLVHLQTHQNVANTSDPELLDRVAKFEKLNLSKSEYHSDRPRRNKAVDTRRDEVITSSPILPINEEDKSKGKIMSGKDEWQTAISKKTMKMIKQLEGVPGIKWKSSIEPVLELKENQNSGASTSRSLSWRRPKTKRFYKTSSKKSGNPNKRSKLKEKRIVLQKIINNLEDYHQPMRRPITLADFMSKLQIDPSEVEEDEQEDEELLHVETCRVISVASTAYQRDSIKDHDRSYITISPTKMTDKITSESCLMVVQTDDNSEEELYFPSDDDRHVMKCDHLSADSFDKSTTFRERIGTLTNLSKKTSWKRWMSKDYGTGDSNVKVSSENNATASENHSLDFTRLKVENAALQESMLNLERLTSSVHRLHVSILKVRDNTASIGYSESLEFLNSIMAEANQVKTAVGGSLPVSWSADPTVAAVTYDSLSEPPPDGSSEERRSDRLVCTAQFEMVELLILATQFFKEKIAINISS
ncbi:hypothetical protein M5K25_025638 [Dendrobium thyrsiflorum]|uniref:Uncharacterized protein n=1 Tax=Dendrobium thyrsiflorum TaxID=117978 RepID=A0ABD0U4H7_DENTH